MSQMRLADRSLSIVTSASLIVPRASRSPGSPRADALIKRSTPRPEPVVYAATRTRDIRPSLPSVPSALRLLPAECVRDPTRVPESATVSPAVSSALERRLRRRSRRLEDANSQGPAVRVMMAFQFDPARRSHYLALRNLQAAGDQIQRLEPALHSLHREPTRTCRSPDKTETDERRTPTHRRYEICSSVVRASRGLATARCGGWAPGSRRGRYESRSASRLHNSCLRLRHRAIPRSGHEPRSQLRGRKR